MKIEDGSHDAYGQSILQELEPAKRFSRWMYKTIEPFLGERILEVGSGIGNISRQLPVNQRLTLSDMSAGYRQQLEENYSDAQNVDVIKLDLTLDEDFEPIRGQYDSVVCLNVLEHIEDDVGALGRMSSALCPGGQLIILVPQYMLLMSEMDRLLGHFRRYSHSELRSKMESVGLEVDPVFNFNSLGALGWLVNNRLLGKRSLGSGQIRLFDALVPLLDPAEKLLPLPGVSVIGVGRKS